MAGGAECALKAKPGREKYCDALQPANKAIDTNGISLVCIVVDGELYLNNSLVYWRFVTKMFPRDTPPKKTSLTWK